MNRAIVDKRVTVHCILALGILSGPLVLAESNFPGHKASLGVYVQDLPSPIFYDTFLPIILEYILPHWNKSDVTFNNWYNCTSEQAPYRYTCPSVYHMNRAILNLHIDFLALQPVTDGAPHTEYYSRLLSHSDFCNLIQRHFSGVYTQPDELSGYIGALEKCNTDLLEHDSALITLDRALPDFNFSIRHPFTKMESNFYNIFYKSISGTNGTLDLVASATLSNARATIQGSLLSVYYAEKYRWSHAVQDCSAQLIPHSLITSENFQEKLDLLSKRERFLTNYQLSIPLSLISKYYSVPLADCTYTNETFVVRLQIPVTNVLAQDEPNSVQAPRLVTLTPATFIYDKKVCHVQLNSEQLYAYDGQTQLAYRTKCRPNELCFNSGTFSSQFLDPCATAVMDENFEQVLLHCGFKCVYTVFADGTSEVMTVGADKFVLTGRGTKAAVSCHSNSSPPETVDSTLQDNSAVPDQAQSEVFEVTLEADGALEVTLPCKCTLVVNSRRYYPSRLDVCPMDTELTMNRITPWHLLKNLDQDGDDLRIDASLLKFYTEATVRKDLVAPEPSTHGDQDSRGSLAGLWIFFGLTSLLLFMIQCYIIFLLRQSNSNASKYTRHQLLFKARDPEPRVGLLETQDEQM